MDTASKVKVQPGKIGTRLDEMDQAIEVRYSKSVDEQMLLLFQAINDPDSENAAGSREESLEKVSHTLHRAQSCIASKNKAVLDELAQELSHSALKIGAAKLLTSAIEVQGMARIGDFKNAAELLGRMEVELIEVKAHYQ